MAGEFLKGVRDKRIEEYEKEGNSERALEIVESDLYTPILKKTYFHPEEESSGTKVRDVLTDMLNDIVILEHEMGNSAKQYQSLISESMERIRNIEKSVVKAKEQIMDLNMLCGEGSGFFQVIPLTEESFETNSILEDGILSCMFNQVNDIRLEVIDVTGNGMEGNEYVLKDGKFLFDSFKTDNRSAMTDDSISTYYEYQRFRTDKREKLHPVILNEDKADVRCTVTLKASQAITSLSIDSLDKGIAVEEIYISEDGLNYLSVLNEYIVLNDVNSNYNNGAKYIYGTGLIAFPASEYVKVTLTSSDTTIDAVGFEYAAPIK